MLKVGLPGWDKLGLPPMDKLLGDDGKVGPRRRVWGRLARPAGGRGGAWQEGGASLGLRRVTSWRV